MEMSLSDMKPGQRGRITHVTGATKTMRRLLEMGVTPGALIALTRRAPLNDPLEIELRGYRLSLRREEAKNITVRREG